jgi:hypothetical protein
LRNRKRSMRDPNTSPRFGKLRNPKSAIRNRTVALSFPNLLMKEQP